MKWVILISILVLGFWGGGADPAACAVNDQEASLIVHFKSGKAFLSDNAKTQLRHFFNKYEIVPKTRIFVVGYTDDRGDEKRNYQLSKKRAQAIRREIISSFGVNATVVMAMGKGEQSPLADNRLPAGRASNRRAEIYLANARAVATQTVFGPKSPHYSEVKSLVDQAWGLIKTEQLKEAIMTLKKARGLGGDQYSDWHSAYGVAGFYADAPLDQVNAHLVTAMRLDQYNFTAREYLSRVTARQKVLHDEVTSQMGRSLETPISITAVVQQYEYLRMFGVEAVSHQELDRLPIDVWNCKNSKGENVVYYFDHSLVYGWAFKKSAAKNSRPGRVGPADTSIKEREITVPAKVEEPTQAGPQSSKKIWESKIFK